jgi:hypothetical protein
MCSEPEPLTETFNIFGGVAAAYVDPLVILHDQTFAPKLINTRAFHLFIKFPWYSQVVTRLMFIQ